MNWMARHFRRDETGSSVVGLVVLFPLVMIAFVSALEVSVLALRKVQLATAATEVTRYLRIASNTPPDRQTLIETLCGAAGLFPDCPNSITVELAPVDTNEWGANSESMQCIDRQEGFVPAEEYVAGDNNQLMLIRICAVFKPVFPSLGVGQALVEMNDGDYAIMDVSFFTNEPSQ
jgi:hypothetical protein